MLIVKPLYAENESGWYMSASANLNYSVYSRSENQDTQTELSFFTDADYLENYGFAVGLIDQNREQKSLGNIADSILFLGGRYHFYPETLPGKLTISLEAYKQNDLLEIISPAVLFLNYKKTFYAALGYTQSDYDSTFPGSGNLKVKQWAPAIGFSFNDQYDWLQLRYYNIALSNDARNPGITKTSAGELKLTHWIKKKEGSRLDNIQIILLAGERLYAVDPDARKIFNFADVQTAAYSVGGNWKLSSKNEFYIFAGMEEYKEAFLNESYSNVFVFSGYKISW